MNFLEMNGLQTAQTHFKDIFQNNIHRDYADAMLDWLEQETDFFTAPSSTKYHGAHPGGLLVHSLNVYYRLRNIAIRDLADKEDPGKCRLSEEQEETVAVIAMLHDVCKVGCYHMETKRRKNPETGRWEDYEGYTYKAPLPLGHGEKSLYLIQRRAAAKKRAEMERERAMKLEEHERKAVKRRAEERRRRIARRRLITLALGALAVVMLLASVIMTITAKPAAEAAEAEITGAAVTSPPVTLVTAEPDMWDGEGEDPLEAEKIEEALLSSGYFSVAVPMCYEYQDYMRTYCAAYECPYPLALAVAEVESHFDMDAVGAAGEVGIMQLNPGPENTYWINLEAETELDPTTPSGNIAAGCYLLGKYMQEYGDANKAAMAYNMGVSGAENAWAEGITSTDYSTAVVEAMERWEVTVNAWNGI